jgi:hypothetical protein
MEELIVTVERRERGGKREWTRHHSLSYLDDIYSIAPLTNMCPESILTGTIKLCSETAPHEPF